MAVALSGSIVLEGSITGSLLGTSSYSSNAGLLNGLDSSVFALTSSLSTFSSSLNGFTSSINTYTASNNASIADIRVATASLYAATASINNYTASNNANIAALNAATASLYNATASLYLTTASLNQYTASLNTRSASFACIDSTNNFGCVQYFSNASNAVSFTSTGSLYSDGGMRLTKDLYVSGTSYFNNVTIFGTQSVNYITSSQLNIASNIITVNTATPTVRFGGLAVYDSGSLGTGLTGSILWDSEDNQWIYSNPSGSTYDSAAFLVGPRNSGVLGNETGITCNFLSKGNGMHHMTSSGIFEDGSRTCFYGNSYISSSGATCFGGNVTGPNFYIPAASAGTYGLADLTAAMQTYGGGSPACSILFYTCGVERMRFTSTGIACFASNVCVTGNADTSAGLVINNGSGASGTCQHYINFTAGATLISRIFRGNGATGLAGGGLTIDNYDGMNIRLNQLGGSGGFLGVSGGVACFANTVCAPRAVFNAQDNGIGEYYFINANANVTNNFTAYTYTCNVYLNSYKDMFLRVNNTGGSGGALVISGGNVGIGTTTTVTTHNGFNSLVVQGSTACADKRGIIELWDGSSGKSVFQNVCGDTYIGQLCKGLYGNGDLFFLTGGTGASATVSLTIRCNGVACFASTVCIGGQVRIITNAEYQLDVQSSTNAAGASIRRYTAGAYAYDVYETPTRHWRTGLLGASYYTIYDQTALTDRFIIDTSGFVGINETTPSTYGRLTVNTGTSCNTTSLFALGYGTSLSNLVLRNNYTRANGILNGIEFRDSSNEVQASIYACATGANNQSVLIFGTNNGTGGNGLTNATERMRITNSGNVGIGACNPQQILSINNPFSSLNALYPIAISQYSTTEMGGIYSTADSITNPIGAGLAFKVYQQNVGLVEKLRITNGGVACFTNTVCSPFLVTNTIEMAGSATSPSLACVGYGMFGYSGVGLGIAAGATGGNQGMGFFTCGNNERMRIITNGNVGIGTVCPGARLQVKASAAAGATDALYIENSSATSLFQVRDDGLTYMRGNVGINISTPCSQLDVRGTITNSCIAGNRNYTIDTAPAKQSIATGGYVDFCSMSGMVVVNNWSDGGVTLYLVGGGSTIAVGSVTATVGAMYYNGTTAGYRWCATYGSTANYGFLVFRTRETA